MAALEKSGRERLADCAGTDDADLHGSLPVPRGVARPLESDVGLPAQINKARPRAPSLDRRGEEAAKAYGVVSSSRLSAPTSPAGAK